MDTICDCCGQRRDVLPYTHDYDDGTSEDYCQECFDAGCDRGSCMVTRQHKPLGVVTSDGSAMTIEEYAAKAQPAPVASVPQAPAPSLAQKKQAQQEAIAAIQAQAQQQMSTPGSWPPAAPAPAASSAPPVPSAAQLQAAGVAATPKSMAELHKMLGLSTDDPVDEKAKEEKPKKEKPPVVPSFLVDSTGEEAVIADVSSFDDSSPRLEVHKLSPLVQDGRRRVLDGSSTQGLSITQCGVNQESRSHGWFIVNSENQQQRIERGEIPVCEKCYPNDEL